MIEVLVVAASAVVRAGLEALVVASPALAVAGSHTSVFTLAEQVERLQPDVVLLDLEKEDEEAIATLLAVTREAHRSSVVLLTTAPPTTDLHSEWTADALRSGVRAILPRTASGDEIIAATLAAAADLVVLQPEMVEALLLPASPAAPRAAPTVPVSQVEALTAREIEVLGMLAEGLGNKTIAYKLSISEHTVKFHVASIFAKLGAASRTEAVTLGIRQGLIML